VTGPLKKDLTTVLDFYREFGIEALPFRIHPGGRPSDESSPVQASCMPKVPVEDKKAALDALRAQIGDCTCCKLSQGRTNLVFGEGNPGAEIMFIGEAPGREEDTQGRPFVGDAGNVLTNLIRKVMNRERSDVYIANICKCRPPQNRDPEADEMVACFPFLNEQIRIVAPKIIVSLGKIATFSLMKPPYPIAKFSIMRERGKWFSYNGVPVMPTFHPAYLMRNPKDKWLTLEDAKAVLARLEEIRKAEGSCL